DPTAAAVASELAAERYDLKVVQRKIEDAKENFTRFLVIGPANAPAVKPPGRDRPSIVFALPDAPRGLDRALAAFANQQVNLSRIESRPSRREAWDYIFFIDLEGHTADPQVARALAALKPMCREIKVLGSYPRAE